MARGVPWAAAWGMELEEVEPFVAAFDEFAQAVRQDEQDRLAVVLSRTLAQLIGKDAGG